MSDWNKRVIEEFRANDGQVGGNLAEYTMLLLHHTGAKSGLPRLNPVVTIPDDDRYIIIASKAGADTHPDWYYNLVAHPQTEIEVGTEKLNVTVIEAQEPERTQLYEKMEARYAFFTEYKHKTSRTIPVFILEPNR